MEYDITRTKLQFIIAWVAANGLGMAWGWSTGEMIGQMVVERNGWFIGSICGWVIFELLLWFTRFVILVQYRNVVSVLRIERIVGLTTEFVGGLIGEGFYQVTGSNWVTVSGVWAALLGGAMWVIIWFLLLSKKSNRFWILKAILWTFIGFVGSSLFIGGILAWNLEVGEFIETLSTPHLGGLISVGLTGIGIGIMTGLAFSRLAKWQS
jgi:hypothetical protein